VFHEEIKWNIDAPVLINDRSSLIADICCEMVATTVSTGSSYLNKRSQIFQVSSDQSGPHTLNCSVPQGSVLGPLMFISYREDLADLISSHQLKYHEFLDDTQLVGRTEIPKVPSTIDSLQRCTADVGDWYASRRLKLNEDKTEFMWCG